MNKWIPNPGTHPYLPKGTKGFLRTVAGKELRFQVPTPPNWWIKNIATDELHFKEYRVGSW